MLEPIWRVRVFFQRNLRWRCMLRNSSDARRLRRGLTQAYVNFQACVSSAKCDKFQCEVYSMKLIVYKCLTQSAKFQAHIVDVQHNMQNSCWQAISEYEVRGNVPCKDL